MVFLLSTAVVTVDHQLEERAPLPEGGQRGTVRGRASKGRFGLDRSHALVALAATCCVHAMEGVACAMNNNEADFECNALASVSSLVSP